MTITSTTISQVGLLENGSLKTSSLLLSTLISFFFSITSSFQFIPPFCLSSSLLQSCFPLLSLSALVLVSLTTNKLSQLGSLSAVTLPADLQGWAPALIYLLTVHSAEASH